MDLNNKTIVILYMLYFGDMVSITPFLEVLRRKAEGSKIILVIDSRFKEAVACNPNIDELIPVDRKKMGLLRTWHLGKEIGKKHPDILLVLHGTLRTTLIGAAMRPKVWTGEAGTRGDFLFMTKKIMVEYKDCHATEKYLKVLRSLGVSDTHNEGMRIYTSPEWEKGADDFFTSARIERGEKLAGFSVGSSTVEKNWPARRFGEVADYFAEKGYRPVFFGVKSELPLIEEAISSMKHRNEAVNAGGKLSMGEFMAAAGRCDIGFTNDSGPMYVFDSRGTSTIALFGPSNVKLHHPLGEKSCGLASTDMPMTQDHVSHTIRDHSYRPIETISVQDVIDAALWAIGEKEDKKYEKHYVILER